MSNYKYSNAGQGQGYVPDSFSSDAGATKKISNHTLRPVTIKQLLAVIETQTDDFRIDGKDLGQVTLIGVVRNINRQSTHHAFTLEDGTGTIETKRFPMDDEDPTDSNLIEIGTYVRIIGIPKLYNQHLTVNVHSIRPVNDFNEVTYHNLEVIHIHVSLTRSKNGMGMASSHNNFGGGIPHSGSMSTRPGASGEDFSQQILDMVKAHPSSSTIGVPRGAIVAFIAPRCGGQETAHNLIEQLIFEGTMYPGQDEDHLMPVEN
ncbi:replication factor A protein 2 [Entomortierella beljakovae]|nr:replication factor A protein 2 [Entomortierella beljakovae]